MAKQAQFKVSQIRPTRLHSWLFVAVSILVLLPMSGAKPVTDRSIFDRDIVARIDGGDFVQPSFSPDGKRLAYAKVVVYDSTELAEVYVRELSLGKTWLLLHRNNWFSSLKLRAAMGKVQPFAPGRPIVRIG